MCIQQLWGEEKSSTSHQRLKVFQSWRLGAITLLLIAGSGEENTRKHAGASDSNAAIVYKYQQTSTPAVLQRCDAPPLPNEHQLLEQSGKVFVKVLSERYLWAGSH